MPDNCLIYAYVDFIVAVLVKIMPLITAPGAVLVSVGSVDGGTLF